MKNNPGWLAISFAVASLAIGLAGCQTNDVQTGYLTPQQTSSSSASTTTTTTTTESTTASNERLPPPSATQAVHEEQREEVVVEKTEVKTEEVTTEKVVPSTSQTKKGSVSIRTGGNTSPPPENQPTASIGGKFGQQKAQASTWKPSEDTNYEREAPAARRTVAKVEADEDADEDEAARSTPAVSSSFRPTETRVLEPQGNARGVVVRINPKAKFVVVKFQYKAFPSVGKVLSVLRNGEKVGQIRITKPVKPPHATGDVLDGEIRIGDSIE